MKKFEKELNAIGIISWGITLMMMAVIWYLSYNEMSFRWAWNDVSRGCDSESIISVLHKLVVWTIVVAGSSNAISTLIRKLSDRKIEEYEECYDELEEEEL